MAKKKANAEPETKGEPIFANQNTTDIDIPKTLELPASEPIEHDDIERFDPRKEAMAEIVKNRQKKLDEENQTAQDQVAEHIKNSAPAQADEPQVIPAEAAEVVAEPAAIEAASPSASAAAVTPASEKYTIIVDGQPIEYTVDELKAQAQLGVGARNKFNEAAELRRQAEALMFSARNSQPQAANTQQAPQQLSDIPETELRDIAKRLNYGSEEEQVQALKAAGILFTKNAGQPNQLTPEVLINAATQNAVAVLKVEQEQEILKNEFKDILADLPLAHATDIVLNQLATKYATLGQQKTRLELFREAGNHVREKYLKPVNTASEPQNNTVPIAPVVTPMPEKLERKRMAPQPPQAANKIAAHVPQENRFNPSSIVANMRKSRGQVAF